MTQNADYVPLDQPTLWVQCSCGTPYVYRQCFTFGQREARCEWLWQRDCKNTRDRPAKEHRPLMWTDDGEYVPAQIDGSEAHDG
jgi:hypothetical protein